MNRLDRAAPRSYIHDVMTKRERIEAVLRGERPDHAPVSFWHHFEPGATSGPGAVDAHLQLYERYDLDWLKVMDDHPFPRGGVALLRTAGDLRLIQPVGADDPGFADQLEVLRGLRARLGPDVLMCTTMFNAWTTLRNWTAPPKETHGPPTMGESGEKDETLSRLLKEDRPAFQAALEAVGASLASFAAACLEAGADGVFLSVRDDWVSTPANGDDVYATMVRPTDLAILDGVRHAPFNVLHLCGKPLDFRGFASYPVAVINWADRVAGPSIAYARDRVTPAIAAGVDQLGTLAEGTPDDVAGQVRDALRQAKDRPILIAPGCTFEPERVSEDNLRAVVAAARGSG